MTTTASGDRTRPRRLVLVFALAAELAVAGCTGASSDRAGRAGGGSTVSEIGDDPVGAASAAGETGADRGFIYNHYKRSQNN